jgi:hypothetical protein
MEGLTAMTPVPLGTLTGVPGSAETAVGSSVESLLQRIGSHAQTAPIPAATDLTTARVLEAHLDAVADLTLYVRQHHAERDVAGIREAALGRDEQPW